MSLQCHVTLLCQHFEHPFSMQAVCQFCVSKPSTQLRRMHQQILCSIFSVHLCINSFITLSRSEKSVTDIYIFSTGFCPIVSLIISNALMFPSFACFIREIVINYCTVRPFEPSDNNTSSSSFNVFIRFFFSAHALPPFEEISLCYSPGANLLPSGNGTPFIGLLYCVIPFTSIIKPVLFNSSKRNDFYSLSSLPPC